MNFRMFSVAHKVSPYPAPSGWIEPFAIGDLARAEPAAPWRDNAGSDTIAHLHPSFSELTAHYWVWKNLPDATHIGFCHYRRCFNFLDHPQIHLPKLRCDPTADLLQFVSQEAQRTRALQLLAVNDVISTRSYVLPETVRAQFCANHPPYLWDAFLDAVRAHAPAWLAAYLPWFDLSNEFRFYPLYICRRDIFEEFCTLLFGVLFPLYESIGPIADQPGLRYQANRYPAFLAERFMMLYFHARGLRVHGAQLFAFENEA